MPCSSSTPIRRVRRPALVGRALLVALLALLVAVPGNAMARGGGDDRRETRVTGVCGRGAVARLKLKADDGAIEAEFEVDHNRNRARWHVSIVHEHRVVWRQTVRTRGPSGSFSVERRLRDLSGADQVVARAVGPRGVTCQASASLR